MSRFGPFALEGPLGDDPSCAVYRAIHVAQSRMVAVKLFDAPLVAKSKAAKQSLVREMDTLTKLKHWNLVGCYGGILEEMQGCIAYEFVEGESLKDLLARRDRLAWEAVVDYAYQIAAGLECAHQESVIHQDLHPDKILIAEDGTVKIADLRVDRSRNPWCASSTRLTIERAAYRAPEQLAGAQKLTNKTDLYSLGCLMFEMLVGQPPFTGESVEAIARQHREDEAPRVDGIIFECPVWLSAIIGQLLEKDPAKRPYGAGAVLLALSETTRQVAAGTSTIAHAAGGFSALQSRVEKDAARELLAQAQPRNRKSRKSGEQPPFYERAKRKFEFNVKFGREPKSEAERLYKEAWDFEQFGDRVAALEKYRGMVSILVDGDEGATRLAFVNLARRKIAEIEAAGSDSDRIQFIESRLQDAEKLSSQGKELDAKKIWRGIIELYGNKPEFQSLVERAEGRLHPTVEVSVDS